MGLPLELLTMAGSTGAAFTMKLVGAWMENKSEERKLLLTQQRMEVEQHKLLVQQGGGFAVTRRFIAVTAVLALLVWPKLAAFFGQPVYVPYLDITTTKFLFGVFEYTDQTGGYRTFLGVPMFEWDKHILISIVGFYMGQTLARKS